MQLSNVITNLPPYHFADAKRKIAERKAAGVDVISLSMGDPDLPAPQTVVERLCSALEDPENHRYPEYRGMRALHEAIAAWFERRFGVRLTPERDILPLLGSKEGLAYVAAAVLNAGDVSLIPDPYYTVYVTGSTTVGAVPYFLPLVPRADKSAVGGMGAINRPLRVMNNYLPDLDAIPQGVLARSRLLWLNYPNNPTAACADRSFFEHAVEFAHRHNVVIVHDMAYAEVYFNDYRPISILQIPGANEVAVELHSLSKTYNMAGFRVGMLVGNPELVDAVGRLKSNIDSGIFRPIQYAAIEALGLPASWIEQRNAIYRRRRDLLVDGCNAIGMHADSPRAGLYVWAAIPEGFTSSEGDPRVLTTPPDLPRPYNDTRGAGSGIIVRAGEGRRGVGTLGSSYFASWLFDKTGVLITPGTNFGDAGEGYVRISLTAPEERIEMAVERMWSALTGR